MTAFNNTTDTAQLLLTHGINVNAQDIVIAIFQRIDTFSRSSCRKEEELLCIFVLWIKQSSRSNCCWLTVQMWMLRTKYCWNWKLWCIQFQFDIVWSNTSSCLRRTQRSGFGGNATESSGWCQCPKQRNLIEYLMIPLFFVCVFQDGWTPLHICAEINSFQIAQLLLTNGANSLAKDNVSGMWWKDLAWGALMLF